MGCWNEAAFVSKVSVGCGDRVVFIILEPHRHMEYDKNKKILHSTRLSSNDGARVMFQPRFLPIFGEYNDYGCVENIDRDDNVEYIEEYYDGKSIEDIIRHLERGEVEKLSDNNQKVEEAKQFAAVFEHEKFYKDAVEFQREEDLLVNQYWGYNDIKEYANLGFVAQEDGTWINNQNPKVIINTEPYREIVVQGSDEKIGFEKLRDLIFKLEKQDILVNRDFLDHILTKTSIEVAIEGEVKIREKARSYDTEGGSLSEHIKNLTKEIDSLPEDTPEKEREELKDELYEMFRVRMGRRCGGSLSIYEIKDLRMANYTLDKGLTQELCDLLAFERVVFSSNNLWCPVQSGEQQGNSAVTKFVLNKALEVQEMLIDIEEK